MNFEISISTKLLVILIIHRMYCRLFWVRKKASGKYLKEEKFIEGNVLKIIPGRKVMRQNVLKIFLGESL